VGASQDYMKSRVDHAQDVVELRGRKRELRASFMS
jgi:hypothetical protein